MKRLLSKVRGPEEKEMPFLEHLEELRRALFAVFAAVMVSALVAYAFSGQVVDYVVVRHVTEAQAIKPMEAFFVRIKVSLLLGLLASLPFVMFQIWNFIVPGLLEQERKLVLPMVVFSTLLFIVGTAFSYLVLTPTMVKMLLAFATEHVRPIMSVDYLFDFIIKLAVACGILFQLPLVVALLTVVRIVTPSFLISKWRHAIVGILIVAAVATPGDGPSQIILAAPIVALYFISILISLAIVRGRGEEESDAGDPNDPNDVPPSDVPPSDEPPSDEPPSDEPPNDEPPNDVVPSDVLANDVPPNDDPESANQDSDPRDDATPKAPPASPVPGGNEWEREADWSTLSEDWDDEGGLSEPPSSPRRFVEQGEDPRARFGPPADGDRDRKRDGGVDSDESDESDQSDGSDRQPDGGDASDGDRDGGSATGSGSADESPKKEGGPK